MLRFICPHFLLDPFDAQRLIPRIIPRIGIKLPVFELPNLCDHTVQKIAVVRNNHDPALISLQIVLKPHQRAEIQMVRRLVQHQKLRLLQKELCQRKTGLFPAGQGVYAKIVVFLLKAHPV